MSVVKIAKVAAFGKWTPQPKASAIDNKAGEIEEFFLTSLAAIHGLKDNSKHSVIESVFEDDCFLFNTSLSSIAKIQIQDALDDDQTLPDNIRRMACEIAQVDWMDNLQSKDVVEEVSSIVKILFPQGLPATGVSESTTLFSEEMGSYFNKVCFSPSTLFESYKARMSDINVS